jgi:hypothetical protein
MAIKTITISNQYFQGFSRTINVANFSSFKGLSYYMKNQLIAYLELGNLDILVEKAKELELHSHEFKFYAELIDSDIDNIFLCHH